MIAGEENQGDAAVDAVRVRALDQAAALLQDGVCAMAGEYRADLLEGQRWLQFAGDQAIGEGLVGRHRVATAAGAEDQDDQ